MDTIQCRNDACSLAVPAAWKNRKSGVLLWLALYACSPTMRRHKRSNATRVTIARLIGLPRASRHDTGPRGPVSLAHRPWSLPFTFRPTLQMKIDRMWWTIVYNPHTCRTGRAAPLIQNHVQKAKGKNRVLPRRLQRRNAAMNQLARLEIAADENGRRSQSHRPRQHVPGTQRTRFSSASHAACDDAVSSLSVTIQSPRMKDSIRMVAARQALTHSSQLSRLF
jgi:hypothetical protein